MIGSNRSFGYDAAATFANFVATPSLWDAFAVHTVIPTVPVAGVATNDHVLLSFLSHAIFSASGTRSEAVYRSVPALAAGGTVAVSTFALARRFGLLAAASAGIYIATNPLFVENSRDLRGYSLAALCSVVATLILAGRWSRWRLAAYSVVMGLAIASQLFAGVVLACHIAWIATRRSRSDLLQLAPAWGGAALLGLGANAGVIANEVTQHILPPPYFYPAFPRDLVLFLVGAPVLLPVGLWLATAGLGLWTQRREVGLWAAAAVVGLVVAVLWLWLRPAFLYPRFFIFLVPAFAFLMAAAIRRWWVLAPVVLVGAVAAVMAEIPGYTEDPLALPAAAVAVERVHASGGQACVLHIDEQVLSAYTSDFRVVNSPDELAGCDAVVVVSWNVDLALRDDAAREFPKLTTLPAYYPAVVLER